MRTPHRRGRPRRPAALDGRDPGGMLRAVASAGAQVREALLRLDDDARTRGVVADGRPRALVVAGMGGSGIAGDVVAAVAGLACAGPVVVIRGYRLPGWVGPLDLVIAVSCSGQHRGDARRRRRGRAPRRPRGHRRPGRLAASPARGGGWPRRTPGRRQRRPHAAREPVGARRPRCSRSSTRSGSPSVPRGLLAGVADQLDATSAACGPTRRGLRQRREEDWRCELSGTLPMIWGTSELAGVAAPRFACQLAENAK